MRFLRQLFAIALLACVFTLSTFAGEMGTGYTSSPTTTAAGEMGTGYTGEMGTGSAQTSSSFVQIFLLTLQGVLPRL
jgi:hypothetical protein